MRSQQLIAHSYSYTQTFHSRVLRLPHHFTFTFTPTQSRAQGLCPQTHSRPVYVLFYPFMLNILFAIPISLINTNIPPTTHPYYTKFQAHAVVDGKMKPQCLWVNSIKFSNFLCTCFIFLWIISLSTQEELFLDFAYSFSSHTPYRLPQLKKYDIFCNDTQKISIRLISYLLSYNFTVNAATEWFKT